MVVRCNASFRSSHTKILYSAHGLKRENLGLSNARIFVSSGRSLCHVGVILTRALTSAPTLSLAARLAATQRGYQELIAVVLHKKVMLRFSL